MILALGLTAFFWLPALAEGDAAQLYLTYSTRGNDYHFNFVALNDVLGGPGTSDPLLLNPPLRIILGWPQIALAVSGLIAVRKMQTREQRAHVIAGAVLMIGLLFMALPMSVGVWDNLPLIRFVQFPWRFVGRALLPVALLSGAAVYTLFHSSLVTREATRRTLFVVVSLVPLIFAVPQLYPRVCSPQPDLSIHNVFAYERNTGHIGVDPLGAYLPVTVKERPTSSPLEAQYVNGGPIRRFDRSVLPSGAQITAETYRPNFAAIDLDTPVDFRATYLTFEFPGWQVTLDDHTVPIVPSDPTGLITFDVPSGRHHIEIAFTDTPVRAAANVISVVAVLGLMISLVWPRQRLRRGINSPATNETSAKADWLWLSVPVIFVLIKLAVIDPQLTPLRQTQLHDDQLAGVTQANIDFGDQMRLLGYTLTPQTAPAGETVRVDLFWRALRPMDTNYQTTVGIVDEAGEIWSPKTVERPRDYQDYPVTSAWPTGAYVVDSFDLPVLPGTPPGQYSIYAEVFTRDTLQPLPAAASATHPSSRPFAAIIAPLDVTHAVRTFNSDQLGIYNFQLDQSAPRDIKLLGLNVDRVDVLPGDSVLLTLFWQATQSPAQNYALTLELLNERSVFSETVAIGGRYSTTQWLTGEQIIDLIRVRVPVDLASGQYHWRGSIKDKVIFDIGELRVTAPDRTYTEPPIQHRIDQTFEGQITLLGYNGADCTMSGDDCAVTLAWRDEQETPTSYKVFVQLLDATSLPRAQIDARPVNGTRPTTSWLPGEVITDTYTLQLPVNLPAGKYRLVTGLYQELNNTRLRLASGNDFVELTTLDLKP